VELAVEELNADSGKFSVHSNTTRPARVSTLLSDSRHTSGACLNADVDGYSVHSNMTTTTPRLVLPHSEHLQTVATGTLSD